VRHFRDIGGKFPAQPNRSQIGGNRELHQQNRGGNGGSSRERGAPIESVTGAERG
jgi:hypothetical protein